MEMIQDGLETRTSVRHSSPELHAGKGTAQNQNPRHHLSCQAEGLYQLPVPLWESQHCAPMVTVEGASDGGKQTLYRPK